MARAPLLLDEQVRRNKRRSRFLVVYVFVILAIVIAAASFLMGIPIWAGLVFGGIGALLYVWISSSFSVSAVLSAAKARPADPKVRAEKLLLYRVEEMAIAAGIPMPRVYVTPSKDINAFATGRNPQEAVVAVTQGTLDRLNQEQLQGILGHELSHIRNYDIRIATLTIALVAMIAIIVEVVFRVMWFGGMRGRGGGKNAGPVIAIMVVVAIVFFVLAPILSRLAYLAMSRQREYLADSSGAMLTRNPEGLASALEKIRTDAIQDPKGSRTIAALFIANPFKRQTRESLWATHPPLVKRAARLRRMTPEAYAQYAQSMQPSSRT